MRKLALLACLLLCACGRDPVIPGCEKAAYYSIDAKDIKRAIGNDATVYECLKWKAP